MSELIEFGLEEKDEVVNYTEVENFKQEASEKRVRFSVVSFNSWHATKFREKAREKGHPLSVDEQLELATQIDQKLAEKLGKSIAELTEVDRINPQSPKFVSSLTHYRDGIGTIRCMSKWQGKKCLEKEECCKEIGDPDQKIGCVIMKYFVDQKTLAVDVDDLVKKKVQFRAWVFSPKKFSKVDTMYGDARAENRFICDVKSTLGEGDIKYQNQSFEHMNCAWMGDSVPAEIKYWIKEEGMKLLNQLDKTSLLGFAMSKPKFLEKLSEGGGGSSSGNSSSGEETSGTPKLKSSYEDLIQ